METKGEILEQLRLYASRFIDEQEEVEPIIQFVNQFEGDDLINRKNFTGHITTSAFIVNENEDELLLLKHKALNRWLQPGGHVDTTDETLIASAVREAVEETGLRAEQLQLVSNFIFDIDSHAIPANSKKQEPAHVHHDVRFLFRCTNSNVLNISFEESTDSNWTPFSQLKDNADFYWVEEKIKVFIEEPGFYTTAP